MFTGLKQKISKSLLIKLLFVFTIAIPFNNLNLFRGAHAGIEFQWDNNTNFRRLKWYQLDSERTSRNTTYFFLRPSDRKSGLLTIDIKIPENFKSTLKTKNISLCRVNIGGFNSKTKCLENIPADIEISRETKKVEIYPVSPIPYNKESYAVVFKVTNPQKSGLYQFHTFGKSSGAIPVASYLGSWTIKIDQL